MVCQLELCDDGIERVKLKRRDSARDSVTSGSTTAKKRRKPNKKKESVLSIVASAPPNNGTTSKDKSTLCLTNSPDTALLQTLDLDLTSRGKDFYPFWNKSREEEYAKLWLPRKTECVDLPLDSLNGCATKMMSNSWFSTKVISHRTRNSPKISWPSCKFSVVDGMENEGTTKTGLTVRKIRIYPKQHQKKILRQVAGATRKMYNETISVLNEKRLPFESEEAWHVVENTRREKSKDTSTYKETKNPWWNKYYVRNFLTPNTSSFVVDNPYLKDIPKATREGALDDAFTAFKANMTNLKSKTISKFKLGFRTKKNASRAGWCFNIAPNAIRNSTIFPRSFKTFGKLEVPKSQRKWLLDKYSHTTKLQKDKYGDYYLIVIHDMNGTNAMDVSRSETQGARILSIDPGVRTRHTVYSNTGYAVEIGKGDITRLCRLSNHIDRSFAGRFNKSNNSKQRRRYHRKERKLRKRANNLTHEITNKTVHFLLQNADVVIIPPFEVQSMVKRKTRSLRKNTCKQMLSWSHYAFRKRLEVKARALGKRVLVSPEHYTSKTCGNCGHLNTCLGSKKEFKCPSCGYEADRDINGARNILLRTIRVLV